MANQQPAKRYFILQTLWSVAESRHLAPGERSDLDDLTPEQIEKLTAGNVIMLNQPAGAKPPATPAQAEPAAAGDDEAAPKRRKAKE